MIRRGGSPKAGARRGSRPATIGRERGLTLLETLIILGVLMILLGALAPLLVNQFTRSRAAEATQEMERIHQAIMGDTTTDTYGYVGDMGRLPQRLSELVVRGTQPLYQVSEVHGVGYGWNGPYLNVDVGVDGTLTDVWGNAYDYGSVGTGQIRSAGPNGAFGDADDIVYPPTPVVYVGSLLIQVNGVAGSVVDTNPEDCVVQLAYSADGAESVVGDETPPFSFSSVHRGLHPVTASCPRADGGTATETVTAEVVGDGGQQLVEIYVRRGEAVIEGGAAQEDDEGETEGEGD